ncbi:phospholipase D family protein [Diplocloster agilis]|uniref:Phospholipase D family protein n=1 Tax=Diplocloster agilis TaxID=2850323 RepID=A0A949K8V8_9FIRM|nr:phospholipase D family protein [Diplocloster agilis]MBU9739468.1 phospholipase D family protein [Diplocloster agilis]
MIMLNQPFNGQLGEILIDKMAGSYNKLTILSAFAKNSGVLRLKPALEQFKSAGGRIEAFIGVDAHGTSYEAVLNLFELCDELYIVHSESPSTTFHSKVYMLSNDIPEKWIAGGSNNLTGGGLWTNFESATYFDVTQETENCVNELENLIIRYKDPAYDCSKLITAKEDIDELLAEDYLRSEMRIQMTARTEGQRRPANTANQQVRLFGTQNGIRLPRLTQQPTGTVIRNRRGQADVQAIMPIIANNDSERMWFETRSLTGGSRNILDLSKLGTVTSGTAAGTRYETDTESIILGGVAFFDVDPEDTETEKTITVNYNGIDYEECVIKFPTGDRSNGSWRLQLKGKSSTGQKIHTVGGTEWLRFKIVVFEKIRTDYYGISVLDEDQLAQLESQSRVVATNGSAVDSKKYGLL